MNENINTSNANLKMNSGGGSGGNCDDGTTGLRATLSSGGRMDYRDFGDGCREFVVRVSGATPGFHDVTIRGMLAGSMSVFQNGNGILVYSEEDNSFPADFPTPEAGDAAEVAGIGTGSFADECPAIAEVCGGGSDVSSCDEDASDFLEIVVTRAPSSGFSTSPCTNVKAQLETAVASAIFINHHPTRTIAIAAVLIPESDRQTIDPSPCNRAIAGNTIFHTVDDCLLFLAEGCNSPPSLLLGPGETSVPWLYNCRKESLFGSGSCGSLVLETTTIYILAQTVFCENFNSAQSSFCAQTGLHLITTGTPDPEFIAYVNSECP